MGTADLMLCNRAPLRTLLRAAVLLILGLPLAWFLSRHCAEILTTERITMLLGFAGGAPFTAIPDETHIQSGEALLADYHITTSLSPQLMACYNGLQQRLFVWIYAAFSVPVVIVSICALLTLLREYRRIERLRVQCFALRENPAAEITDAYNESDSIGRMAEGVLCIGRQMRHMTEHLRQEKHQLAEFLTDLSHQLKTVLAVIRLNSDLLAQPYLLDETQRTQLTEEMAAQLDHMESLLRTSLKLAKLDAGAVSYQMTEQSLLCTCQAAATELAPMLRSADITLTLADTDASLLHDAVWLREAIQNIIKNAVDHAGCDRISITVTNTPAYATITIEDNGKGIPHAEILHLFERFGKRSNRNDMQSVGVGLAIAKRIVTAHGGEITVFSEEGKGSRFVLTFLR